MAVKERRPLPEGAERARLAIKRREEAARLSGVSVAGETDVNTDEEQLADEAYPVNFTKGLLHDKYGQLKKAGDYERLVKEINQQDATNFSSVATGLNRKKPKPLTSRKNGDTQWRGWESPRTGHYFDLQGPDADAVGMPAAPKLGSDELAAEMAEVYALALLRDVPFSDIEQGRGKNPPSGLSTAKVLNAVSSLSWFKDDIDPDVGSAQERRRRLARRIDHGPDFDENEAGEVSFDVVHAFRGSAPGAKAGPYVSQYMLMGNRLTIANGPTLSLKDYLSSTSKQTSDDCAFEDAAIGFGTQLIGQRASTFEEGKDFMLHWNAYLDVQNGADFGGDNVPVFDNGKGKRPGRFIATPRHLATYVRYDALYQAYLNACLFMLGELGNPCSNDAGTRFGLQQPVVHPWHGSKGPGFPDRSPREHRQGFAAFGGPHVLTLVTEVATRCLKAVRRQKFNFHRRARPERLGALLTLHAAEADSPAHKALGTQTRTRLDAMSTAFADSGLLRLLAEHNSNRLSSADAHLKPPALKQPCWWNAKSNYLLPMAFAEGSPMHPSYGAGHATVAGGCVTMLKAFFHTVQRGSNGKPTAVPWPSIPIVQATSCGHRLEPLASTPDLTVAGELNKLAANISIGRNMAGVHYYTDYYESLRMGERIAIGMLIEQMKQYNEPVEFDLHTFDGDHVHLLKNEFDDADPRVFITDPRGNKVSLDEWWCRHSG